jgi:hypothetical protein
LLQIAANRVKFTQATVRSGALKFEIPFGTKDAILISAISQKSGYNYEAFIFHFNFILRECSTGMRRYNRFAFFKRRKFGKWQWTEHS